MQDSSRNKGLIVVITVVASLATIGSFLLYVYDIYKNRYNDIHDFNFSESGKYLLKHNYYEAWKISDISDYIDVNKWDIFLNYNFSYVNFDGMVFNGILLQKGVENCIKKCEENNCYFWSYEKSGWCNVFKKNDWLSSLKETPLYGWQDVTRISARRK